MDSRWESWGYLEEQHSEKVNSEQQVQDFEVVLCHVKVLIIKIACLKLSE